MGIAGFVLAAVVIGALGVAWLIRRWDEVSATWLTVGAGIVARLGGCAALGLAVARVAPRGGLWIAVAIALAALAVWMILSAAILGFGLVKYGSRSKLRGHL